MRRSHRHMTPDAPSPDAVDADAPFEAILRDIRACRICRDQARYGKPLAHEPRPVVQVSESARLCIAGQAPGVRVHRSGRPFDDPSGTRLRRWMGVGEEEFYDPTRVAIIPMGFCFPGQKADGGDLPPRRECAEAWRGRLFSRLPGLEILLVVGGHAQRWHLGTRLARDGVDEAVRSWRRIYEAGTSPRMLPLPHPSWHNNRWCKQNPWFETEVLPVLRREVRIALS